MDGQTDRQAELQWLRRAESSSCFRAFELCVKQAKVLIQLYELAYCTAQF